MIYTKENWEEFIAAKERGELCEIDLELFYHFLEVLPPAWMNKTKDVQGTMRKCNFGFVEGWDYVDAFWREGGRYFCQKTTEYFNDDK